MSYKNILLAVLGVSMLSLTACNDDPVDQTDVYQQYYVIVTPEARMAYANFRAGTATGDRLKIDGDESVKVNSMPMFFVSATTPAFNDYNYVCALPDNHEKVIFSVDLGKTTLTNSFELKDVPAVVIPETMAEITNKTPYTLDLGALSPSQVSVRLEKGISSASADTYEAQMNLVSGSFMFVNVPAGSYRLCVEGTYAFVTEDNDGSAGGEIKVTQRSEKNVTVVE